MDHSCSSSGKTGAYTGSAYGAGSASIVFDIQIETLNNATHIEHEFVVVGFLLYVAT